MSVTAVPRLQPIEPGRDRTIRPEHGEHQWKAGLELGFESRKQRTVLVRRHHHGPLYVQKPFYPEGDACCHTYLLHPPAGIVGGDQLSIKIELAEDSHALLTTPAATKFYRANPQAGTLSQSITMKPGAKLEWLPQENIIFNGARAETRTIFHLSEECRLIAWESQCLGRPASDEVFKQGHYRQRFEVWLEKQPLLVDALGMDAGSSLQTARWGLADLPVNSLLVAYPVTDELLSLVNTHIQQLPNVQSAASLLDGLLVIRCPGDDTEKVQTALRRLWRLIRPQLLAREACPPRIWNT